MYFHLILPLDICDKTSTFGFKANILHECNKESYFPISLVSGQEEGVKC